MEQKRSDIIILVFIWMLSFLALLLLLLLGLRLSHILHLDDRDGAVLKDALVDDVPDASSRTQLLVLVSLDVEDANRLGRSRSRESHVKLAVAEELLSQDDSDLQTQVCA